MNIPWHSLDSVTLNNILIDVATRDGTDYGNIELSLEQKVQKLKELLQIGQINLIWDEQSQSININQIEP